METIQILSSRLREEELENERLRREKDAESEKALRAVMKQKPFPVVQLTFPR